MSKTMNDTDVAALRLTEKSSKNERVLVAKWQYLPTYLLP